MREYLLILAGLSLLMSCGKSSDNDDDSKQSDPSTGAAGEVSDTSQDGITTFIGEATFLQWSTKQSAPVDSVSAHRNVSQTYFNDTVAAALERGDNPLPQGSVLVKTMYDSDRSTIVGHALMAKVAEGSEAETWVWFEGFLPSYSNPFYGKANGTCTGCHSSGVDYVRSPLPE